MHAMTNMHPMTKRGHAMTNFLNSMTKKERAMPNSTTTMTN